MIEYRTCGTSRFFLWTTTCLFMAIMVSTILLAPSSASETENDRLLIDPMLLTALAECRSIVTQVPDGFYPGWEFASLPVLFYKPGVQDVLINFPHMPEGFRRYQGFNPLGDETIYVRDEETYIEWDDQNTTREIDGVITLVVADTYSSQRNQIRGTIANQADADIQKWLDNWDFVPSPYEKIRVILHEAFHAHQNHLAPEKGADEGSVAMYPLLDPVNNALSQLEGLILKDALLAVDKKTRTRKTAEFVAVRSHRQSLLSEEFALYENLNEFTEGTAKYIEFKFLSLEQELQASSEMYFAPGFHGYSVLHEIFEHELDDMVNIVGVTDNRFGNRFGGGPLRFKLYVLGAAQALLLDHFDPSWKKVIFDDDVFLCDQLKKVLALNTDQMNAALKRAQVQYGYSDLLAGKKEFQTQGKEFIQAKVNAILKTDDTLVVLDYTGFEIAGMGYTPFGVTRVDANRTIYDMVPLQVLFGEDKLLSLKEVRPVLVDKSNNTVSFVTAAAADDFTAGNSAGIEVANFKIEAKSATTSKADNQVTITF